MQKSYGSVKTNSLADVVNNKDFRTLWGVTKDDVDVCRDCEFRYICTDCRAYTQDTESQHSKPIKCDYDPYTGVWQ